MILFSTPRPFEGQYAIIQENAWRSWALLDPPPDKIVIFADLAHEGERALALAGELGFVLEPIQGRSERGVPLLPGLFGRAFEMDSLPCYVNSDIILEGDLVPRLKEVASHFDRCLLCARRWNVQVLGLLDFDSGWHQELRDKVEMQGSRNAECAIDLFAWKGDLFKDIAPFAIGRYTWDNNLLAVALRQGAPVVDITPVVRLTHQSHKGVPWHEPDADYNRTFIRNNMDMAGLQHCTHTCRADGKLVIGWVADSEE